MIYTNEVDRVREAIRQGPHAGTTFNLFMLCITHARGDEDDGLIPFDRDELARRAGIAPQHVSRSMALLVKYRAVTKYREKGRVQYFMNPLVGWYGRETDYQARARHIRKTLEDGVKKHFGQPNLGI